VRQRNYDNTLSRFDRIPECGTDRIPISISRVSKQNKVSKSEWTRKNDMHIIFESILKLFTQKL